MPSAITPETKSAIAGLIFGSGLKRDPRLGAARRQEVQARTLRRFKNDVPFISGPTQPGLVAPAAGVLTRRYALGTRMMAPPRPCWSLKRPSISRALHHRLGKKRQYLYRVWSAMRCVYLYICLSACRNDPGRSCRRLGSRWWLSVQIAISTGRRRDGPMAEGIILRSWMRWVGWDLASCWCWFVGKGR